jgi:hypothetical protein
MDMERYSVVEQKNRREIVLLRGRGCVYKRCTFCDYHLDKSPDDEANFALNAQVLSHVTGQYGDLEVINSGSVFELDDATLDLIRQTCLERGIHTLHFEAHWLFRKRIPELRRRFAPLTLKMKLGLESFDYDLRENVLDKGIAEADPALIAQGFDEANFLVGIAGQTVEGLRRDFELGLSLFERICVNVMCANTTPVVPDQQVISAFMAQLYPALEADPRADVLLNNTDFGVGA